LKIITRFSEQKTQQKAFLRKTTQEFKISSKTPSKFNTKRTSNYLEENIIGTGESSVMSKDNIFANIQTPAF
jgi:hypothetical protein